MDNKEKIIKRLMKIKALAEQGASGEREAAERLLADLMSRYGITDDDLSEDVSSIHLAKIKEGFISYKLFVQMCGIVMGVANPRILDMRKASRKDMRLFHEAGYGPVNANAGVDCTASQFAEIMSMYEFYIRDFEIQEDTFLYAYLDKNNLLIPRPSSDDFDVPDDDIDKAIRAMRMKEGIERQTYHKQIKQ